MPAPKSVVKVKKTKASDGIDLEFTSSVNRVEYLIYELNRAALRDVAKFVKAKFRESYYQHFQRNTGAGGKAVSAKVYAGKSTTAPRVEIGLDNKQKPGFYAFFQEFGTKKTPKLGLLQKAVSENIAEIVKIESLYLSGLEDEAAALAKIDSEDDYIIEEDDE